MQFTIENGKLMKNEIWSMMENDAMELKQWYRDIFIDEPTSLVFFKRNILSEIVKYL